MMRPPRGSWTFIILIASCAHRNTPVRLTSTAAVHCSNVRSSIGTAGAPVPALLKGRSKRPNISLILLKSARTACGLLTSVGTTSIRPSECFLSPAVFSNSWTRRPANTTAHPFSWKARLTARPIPLPAPVTSAIFSAGIFIVLFSDQPGTDGPWYEVELQDGRYNHNCRTPNIRHHSSRGSGCARAHLELSRVRNTLPSTVALQEAASGNN